MYVVQRALSAAAATPGFPQAFPSICASIVIPCSQVKGVPRPLPMLTRWGAEHPPNILASGLAQNIGRYASYL